MLYSSTNICFSGGFGGFGYGCGMPFYGGCCYPAPMCCGPSIFYSGCYPYGGCSSYGGAFAGAMLGAALGNILGGLLCRKA